MFAKKSRAINLIISLSFAVYLPQNEVKGTEIRTGPNPFNEAVASKSFVDKTALFKFFHRFTVPVMVTAPKYFGKTTTLWMLRTFYEIPVDESGSVLDKNTTRARALFAGLAERERLEPTVYEDETWCQEQMGELPVIHYNFENVSVNGVMDFLESFRHLTAQVCNEHKYLLKSPRLSPANKTLLSSYCDAPVSGLTRQGLCAAGRDMSTLLAAHFERPCLVLADELDAPILKLLQASSVKEEEMQEILAMLRELAAELLVNNTAVRRGFLMGNTRLATAIAPSNVIHWQFTENEEIAPYFGFSEKELEFLIRDTDLLQKDIRLYYDGYRGMNSSLWVYNPYSLRRHLRTHWLGVYWSAAVPLEAFANLFKTDQFVRGVFSCGAAVKEIKVMEPRRFSVEQQMAMLREMLTKTKPVTETGEMIVLVEFLYELGYFTDKTVPRSTPAANMYFIVITPNKEIGEMFNRFCKEHS